jgi:ketosteroid isomerase-like protein
MLHCCAVDRSNAERRQARDVMADDERAIRNLVATWMQASERGDVNTLLSLMADDVIFTVPGREPFGKDAFRAASSGGGDAMRRKGYTLSILRKQADGKWVLWRDANLVA